MGGASALFAKVRRPQVAAIRIAAAADPQRDIRGDRRSGFKTDPERADSQSDGGRSGELRPEGSRLGKNRNWGRGVIGGSFSFKVRKSKYGYLAI